MHNPAQRAEADEPEDAGSDEKEKSGEKTSLQELAESGDKQAGQRRNHVSRRTLARCHDANKRLLGQLVDSAKAGSRPAQALHHG